MKVWLVLYHYNLECDDEVICLGVHKTRDVAKETFDTKRDEIFDTLQEYDEEDITFVSDIADELVVMVNNDGCTDLYELEILERGVL